MDLISVIIRGFLDSLNPCNLSTAIIFAGYLSLLRKFQENVNVWGWVFIGFSWMFSFLALYGFFISILYSDAFFQFGRVFYCVVGVVFMLLGCFIFKSWIQFVKNKSCAGWLLHDVGVRKKSFFVLPALNIPVSAIFLNSMATVWPMDGHVTLLAYDLWDPAKLTMKTVFLLALYSLIMVFPLILARFWIPLSSSEGWVAKNPTRAKSIVSAVLLGMGFSLVYVFR